MTVDEIVEKVMRYKSYIIKEEFLLLYKEVKFIIYNPKDSDLVDEIKDKEYYSWTHK